MDRRNLPRPVASPRRLACALAAIVALAAAPPAAAQMTPLLDLRVLSSRAELLGQPDEELLQPVTPFESFDQYLLAEVWGGEAGVATAESWQNSSFYPGGIFAAGGTTGQFQVYPGAYDALSLSTMTFRVDTCVTYILDATMEPGDPQSQGEITLGVPVGAPDIHQVATGHAFLQGRLSPGEYFVEGRSSVSTFGPGMNGPTYGLFWTCQPCASTLIKLQPQDVSPPAGGNASFTVVPSAPAAGLEAAAALAFQWRRNRVPLADGGRIAGSQTGTLSITGVTVADTGWYDVVVTEGPIEEPSAYARLNLGGPTGVAPLERPSAVRLAFEGATPNPSRGTTSFRFSAPQPVRAQAEVYDAAGRLARSLGTRWLSGTGTLAWDGRDAAGVEAPAGVYFLRVRADGETFVRRFARLR